MLLKIIFVQNYFKTTLMYLGKNKPVNLTLLAIRLLNIIDYEILFFFTYFFSFFL